MPVSAPLDVLTSLLSLIGPIGWTEIVVLAVLGVLIFGRRLPEVGRNIGRGIVEFKRGLQGIESEVDEASRASGEGGASSVGKGKLHEGQGSQQPLAESRSGERVQSS